MMTPVWAFLSLWALLGWAAWCLMCEVNPLAWLRYEVACLPRAGRVVLAGVLCASTVLELWAVGKGRDGLADQILVLTAWGVLVVLGAARLWWRHSETGIFGRAGFEDQNNR